MNIMSIPEGEFATQEVQAHLVFNEGGHLAARRTQGRMEIQAMARVNGAVVGGPQIPYEETQPWRTTEYLSRFLQNHPIDPEHMALLVQQLNAAGPTYSGNPSYSYLTGGLDYHFPTRDVGFPAEAVRAQLRGRCTHFTPWTSVFADLMNQLPTGFGCEILKAAYDPPGPPKPVEPGFGAWRHQMGFFPHFNGPTGNSDATFNVAYEFQVANFRPSLALTHWRTNSVGGLANGKVLEGLSKALVTTVPSTFTATMQSLLARELPGKIVLPSLATYPAACSLTAPDPDDCRKRTTQTLETILITHLKKTGLSDGDAIKRANEMVSDFKPADFTCEPAFHKDGATPEEMEEYSFQLCTQPPCAGGSCGACTFHVPVQAVNVYNDGFEVVMREAENDTLAALQMALLESTDPKSATQLEELNAICNASDGPRVAFTRPYTVDHVHDHAYFDTCPAPGPAGPPQVVCKP